MIIKKQAKKKKQCSGLENDDTLIQLAAQMYGSHVDSGLVFTDGDKKYVMLVDEHLDKEHQNSSVAAIYLMRPISERDFMLGENHALTPLLAGLSVAGFVRLLENASSIVLKKR